MASKKFWFVWNVDGRAPTRKHTSEGVARKEAERLANINPGQEFVVLASVASCRMNYVAWESHEPVNFVYNNIFSTGIIG